MISVQMIEKVKQRLIKTYNPLVIYLFGSYAWGHPSEDSDLDLLIVIEKYAKDNYQTVLDGHRALIDLDVAKDLFVLDKKEFDTYSLDRREFFYEIKKKGKVLYARA